MAKRQRDRTEGIAGFDLADEEVDGMWDEIVLGLRRHKPGEATAAWVSLGEGYKSLGHRRAT